MNQSADTSTDSQPVSSDSANPPETPQTFDQTIDRYEARLASQQAIVDQCVQRWNRVAVLRGLTFLISLVPLGMAIAGVAGVQWPWVGLAAIFFLGFLTIAFFSRRHANQIPSSHLDGQLLPVSYTHLTLPTILLV